MPRRTVTLLLTVLVAIAGVALGACPQGRCATMQAAPAAATHAGSHPSAHHGTHAGMQHDAQPSAATTHDCCERDGIARPHCCPDAEQLVQRQAAPSTERASSGFQIAAAQAVPTILVAPTTSAADPPRASPLGAPPGTLIAQHTSLLV